MTLTKFIVRMLPATYALALAFGGGLAAHATTITVGGISTPGSGVHSSVAGTTENTFDSATPIGFSYSGGQVVSGSISGVYAAPTDDTTSYLTTGNGTATITAKTLFSYFGLYWGSIDSYNTITLSRGEKSESYSGSDIASRLSLVADGTNSAYINFFAGESGWNRITLSSTQNAFESDNHAFAVASTAAPEPASLLGMAMGLSLLIVGGFRRRRAVARA